jgi:hypothetical protein
MRELRVQAGGDPLRILYAFDPRRTAILLLGGDKTGDDRWYETNVALADRLRYDVHHGVRLLFTVSQTFTIQGRGITLLPELKPVGGEVFMVGDPLRLKRPDGTEDTVKIGGLGFAKVLNAPCQLLVLLRNVNEEDVPPGTEVWSVDLS